LISDIAVIGTVGGLISNEARSVEVHLIISLLLLQVLVSSFFRNCLNTTYMVSRLLPG
jgi:nucleoside permease NupC